MRFAQMEMKIALAKLLTKYRLTGEKFDPLGKAAIETSVMAILHRIKEPLLVTIDKLDN